MYGDSDLMSRRAGDLREQAIDLRALADRLVAQAEASAWTGRAADALRERVSERARAIRVAAGHHETAADTLEKHRHEVDALKETIAVTERRADSIVSEARRRIADVEKGGDADSGVVVEPDADDVRIAAFEPPPAGHRDWLAVELPGL